MYGRVMNNFEDYIPNEKLQITKRSKEIKTQYEELVEEAKQNVTRKQSKQIKQQDNSRNVTLERMSDGQLVTIKSLKIAGKLQPKYHGIYKIIGSTKYGNYRLESMDGTELKQAFVPERLKKVAEDISEDDPNAHVEVETILKHRKRKGKYEYLVKWANQPESENCWEPESSFDTIEIIEEYWASINKTPQANLATTNPLFKIISLLMIFSTIPTTDAIRIRDKFKLSEIHDNKAIWDIPESCKINHKPAHNVRSDYYILSKLTNEVDGRGWYCTILHRQASTHMSWGFRNQIFGQIQQTRELTKEDCAEMVRTKKCGKNHMKCSNDYCKSDAKPEFEYSYFGTTTQEWDECEVYAQTVEAINAKSRILTNEHMLTSCTPNDLYCKLPNGILIWDGKIIKTCPYQYVKSTTLQSYGHILVSEKENKLFQITKNETICNDIEAWNTAEGFYLTKDSKSLTLVTAIKELRVVDELILTEIDYQKMSIMNLVTHLNSLQNTKMCQLYKSFINLYSKTNDEFFTFSDFNGNEAVVYSSEGQIFIPKCVEVHDIELVSATKQCYKDIPIKITHKDNTQDNVFLTTDRIIRTTSRIVPCKNNFNSVHLPHSKRIITTRENKTIVSDDSQYKHINVNLQHANVTSFNFHHDERIITSVNIVKKSAKISIANEDHHGEFYVKEDYRTEIRGDLNNLIERLDLSIWTTVENWFRTIASYAGSFGFFILAFIFIRGIFLRRSPRIDAVSV